MRKKRFLAIAAAIVVSMAFAVSATTAFATEADGSTDTVDDEQEEGEQTTVTEPGAESGGDSGTNASGGQKPSDGQNPSGGGGGSSSGSGTAGAKSSDSSLAYLDIAPGDLSPAFSAGTYSYTSTVDADVTKLSVAARPNSSKAVIASVSGAKSITPGTNTVKVVVEAENGATSTYTIAVTCGTASSPANTPAQTPDDADTPDDAGMPDDPGNAADDAAPEGEISLISDTGETGPKEEPEITFDKNGYLIYEGNAYIPSEQMPEGEYVSLDKYNKLYEQAQKQRSSSMRLVIIFVIILVLLLIVILNLALKLRDVRQDMRLGINEPEENEKPTRKRTAKAPDTAMIPDVKLPEQMKTEKKQPEKAAEKTRAQEKKTSARKYEDLEILDLNDL